MESEQKKREFLLSVFENTYERDILERYKIRNPKELREITEVTASSVGALTSTRKLKNTFKSSTGSRLSRNTIARYLGYLKNSFLIDSAVRYDIKGRRYIGSPVKYYFTDLGIRKAVTGFRQLEETHIMENIIFNELKMRGYQVDAGSLEIYEKNAQGKDSVRRTEVDFAVNMADRRYYIQSALRLDTREKTVQEERPLLNINDSFKKIILVGGAEKPWHTEEGILVMGALDFLLNPNAIND